MKNLIIFYRAFQHVRRLGMNGPEDFLPGLDVFFLSHRFPEHKIVEAPSRMA
jgi:hypothetical protein